MVPYGRLDQLAVQLARTTSVMEQRAHAYFRERSTCPSALTPQLHRRKLISFPAHVCIALSLLPFLEPQRFMDGVMVRVDNLLLAQQPTTRIPSPFKIT